MNTDPRPEAAARALYAGDKEPRTFEESPLRNFYTNVATVALPAAQNVQLTTYAELDALPVGSIIVSEQGGVWQKHDDEETRELAPYWMTIGTDELMRTEDISLPATLKAWGEE